MTDLLPAQTTDRVRRYRAFVASATRIQLVDGKSTKREIGRRQNWQAEAWNYFDEVPEIKYGTLWLANIAAKVVFFAGYEMDNGDVVPVNSDKCPIKDTAVARDAVLEMERLKAAAGGQGQINWLGVLNLEVVGEFFIHGVQAQPAEGLPGDDGYKPAVPESWTVRSVSQVSTSTNSDSTGRPIVIVKEAPDDKGREIDNDTETLLRIHQSNPQWPQLADNHLRSLISDCETLVLLQNQQKAEAKSRQAPGILLVPSELNFADDADPDNGEGGDESDQPQRNPFVDALSKALVEPIEDPSSVAAVMPLVISAPAEFLTPDRFRLLSLARGGGDDLEAKLSAKIDRLARGMNVPVEVVMGHMSTTFSNAEQIDEDKFKDHAEPRCDMLADGYEYAYLIPNLTALGYDDVDTARIRVGYEAGAVVASASAEENADALWSAGAISYAAYRRLKGAHEDDAPNREEFLVQLGARKGIFTSDLTTLVLQKGGVDLGARVNAEANDAVIIEDEGNVNPTGDVDNGVEDDEAEAVVAAAGKDYGRKLAEIDRLLRAQLQGAVEGAMSRALERAGNRVKARRGSEVAAAARRSPAYRAASDVGQPALTAAGLSADELLEGAWDEFGDQFKLWGRDAGQEALDVVSEILGGMKPAAREALKLRQLASIDEAWAWLSDALGQVGKEILFSPERGAVAALETVGEWASEFRVPPGLIREALALAGGQTGMLGEVGVLEPTNNAPVGGIATGETVMDTLGEAGAEVEAFRWVYGPGRRRAFEPHRRLSGTVFVNFDDAVLANTSGWPATAFYYPGDHRGCLCDFEPFIIPPPTAATETK